MDFVAFTNPVFIVEAIALSSLIYLEKSDVKSLRVLHSGAFPADCPHRRILTDPCGNEYRGL